MILAIDSLGSTYISLVQSNSNSKIMEIFIIELVKRLDEERPGWRKNTVWIWDNAVSTKDSLLKTFFFHLALSCISSYNEGLASAEGSNHQLRST